MKKTKTKMVTKITFFQEDGETHPSNKSMNMDESHELP